MSSNASTYTGDCSSMRVASVRRPWQATNSVAKDTSCTQQQRYMTHVSKQPQTIATTSIDIFRARNWCCIVTNGEQLLSEATENLNVVAKILDRLPEDWPVTYMQWVWRLWIIHVTKQTCALATKKKHLVSTFWQRRPFFGRQVVWVVKELKQYSWRVMHFQEFWALIFIKYF